MIKTLYIMRHGHAKPTADGGDFHRPLTATGARDVLRVGSALNALGGVDMIAHSPLVRTTMTANLVLEQLKVKPPVVVSEPLRSGASAAEMMRELQSYTQYPRLLIIGHMPDVAEFSANLASEDLIGTVVYSPGAVVACSLNGTVAPGSGKFLWAHVPATIHDAVRV